MPRVRRFVVSLLAVVLQPVAAQEPALRLVPAKRPESLLASTLPWLHSLHDAETAAREKHTNVLLFFTAKWCGPCKRVERETFPDAEVEQELARVALAHLDIDVDANAEACRRHLGHEGVPTFVLLDEHGAELHRWVGARNAAAFLRELRTSRADAVREFDGVFDEHVARAEHCLRRNDAAGLARHLEALERFDGARSSTEFGALLWQCCTEAKRRGDHAWLRAAAQRYLALPSPSHADEARVLLGVAGFDLDGTTTPELQQYIDARLATFAKPFPGSTAAERVQKLLGAADPIPAGATGAWVDASNTAMDELTDVGRAAAASLRRAFFADPEIAENAAVVLGRMKLPETTPWLIERLDDPETPPSAKTSLLWSVAMHKEPRCLPTLLRFVGPGHPPHLRGVAADGIKELALQRDDVASRHDVADALATALEARDRRLIAEVLQAMFQIEAPLRLERLIELLSDRRPLGWGDDYRVGDNALWVLLRQIGLEVQRPDGTFANRATPDVVTFLERWHEEAAPHLRWDADAKHWRREPK